MRKITNKKGGSPASIRVMSVLPTNCNLTKNVPLTSLDNSNISDVNLYQTTGGGKRLKKYIGGSPASIRVMNLLATDCNLAKGETFSPIENSNISRVNLYQTTGGRRSLNKRRRTKNRKRNRGKKTKKKLI